MDQQPMILVVEDDPDILLILRSLMRELTAGYEIVSAADAVEALAFLSSRRVALLLTDYNMPGMNGLDLALRARVLSPTTHVILVSAYATEGLERQARVAGLDTFIAKPFAVEHLNRAVSRALGRG